MSVARRTGWYLMSSLGVPLLSILTLPLFTTKLGPEEFGVFALGASLASIVSATASTLCYVSLPVELIRLKDAARRNYMAAVLVLGIFATVVGVLLVAMLYVASSQVFGFSLLTSKSLCMAMFGAFLNSLWNVCMQILIIEGAARRYAATSLLQAVANALVIVIALFVFDDVSYALFWGFMAAGFVGAVSASAYFFNRIAFHHLDQWLPVASRGCFSVIASSLSENGKIAFERFYLGAIAGVGALGIFSHAQYYKNAAMSALNALSCGVLPTALGEAQEDKPLFTETLRQWALVQGFVLCVGLVFALIGREVIGLLTHGKFVESTPYTVALLMALLLQTAAKPHITLLMSRGHGHIYAYLSTLSIVVALICLVVAVPYIGIWGAVLSFALQILFHRVSIYIAANRIHRLPFLDHWIVVGLALIAVCTLMVNYWNIHFFIRLSALFAMHLIIMYKLKPVLTLMWLSLKHR